LNQLQLHHQLKPGLGDSSTSFRGVKKQEEKRNVSRNTKERERENVFMLWNIRNVEVSLK
jgi:hypothetical protein